MNNLIPKEFLKGKSIKQFLVKGYYQVLKTNSFTNNHWLIKYEYGSSFFIGKNENFLNKYFNGTRDVDENSLWNKVKQNLEYYEDLTFWGTCPDGLVFINKSKHKIAINSHYCKWILKIIPDMHLKGITQEHPVLVLSNNNFAGLISPLYYEHEDYFKKFKER